MNNLENKIIKNPDYRSQYDKVVIGLAKGIAKGLLGIIISAELTLLTYAIILPKDKKEISTIEDSSYYKRYYQSGSTIQLQDLDKDGSYDWKTVYNRETGERTCVAKESYFKKYGIPERRKYVTIIPDTTRIN